jgi:hypothetical protein
VCALALRGSLLLGPPGEGRATSASRLQQRDPRDPHRRGREGRDNEAVSSLPKAPWWTWRRAASHKPATYRCPFCGGLLPALSEHLLIAPEGDTRRRRHAHTECVLKARRAGRLPGREEWLRSQPRPRPWWRLWER